MVDNSIAVQIPKISSFQKRTFKLIPLLSGRHKIEFNGILPLGWAGSMAQGLSTRRINILSGYAKRTSLSQWIGDITVESEGALEGVAGIDFETIIHEC